MIMFLAIVPAFNEEKNIGSVVKGLFNHIDRVVVVDDGSSDSTSTAASEAGAVVLRHEINRGQGAALETGRQYALKNNADYVLHFDADGQFEVSDISPALEALQKSGADILFGSRFLGRDADLPFFKRFFIFPIAKLFNMLFVGRGFSDAHNGFRILNRRALEKIKIEHDRMAHASEIPFKAKKAGLKCIEFSVKVVYREYGQGILGGVKIIRDLLLGKFTK